MQALRHSPDGVPVIDFRFCDLCCIIGFYYVGHSFLLRLYSTSQASLRLAQSCFFSTMISWRREAMWVYISAGASVWSVEISPEAVRCKALSVSRENHRLTKTEDTICILGFSYFQHFGLEWGQVCGLVCRRFPAKFLTNVRCHVGEIESVGVVRCKALSAPSIRFHRWFYFG